MIPRQADRPWPLVPPRRADFDEPLELLCGARLGPYTLAYEEYGPAWAKAERAILICHGLTATAHAAGRHHPADPKPGWWDLAIGPGKAIDTDKYYVLCSNVLGGFGGSTGPGSIDPATGRPFGLRLPPLTVADMVAAQVRLADRLGVERFHCVIGGCMGGFQALEWLAAHPQRLESAIVIGSAARVSAHTLALWEVIREAIRRDPGFNGGDYYDGPAPASGMSLGSMFGMMIWMSKEVMERRFGLRTIDGGPPRISLEPQFAIQEFFQKIGQGGSGGVDPNSLIYLTKAMDFFDLSRGRDDLAQAFAGGRAKALLVSYRSDWRYPPAASEQLRQAMAQAGLEASHVELQSDFGHGAFIYDAHGVGRVMADFLAELARRGPQT
ncbi:homoserine O-acetyltransferase [Desulfarculus baarsii DSM 2075]|uniref:Probable acyltransferase n=1 Tax=Desulfarculus baarsii (strain ATCC 33931 / DSM 2075 / LMG 7858 / VKM B-1802 / 2st14) TaxID=644282 RepID=E1QJW4_DESB2|nr:homoserine O-acetyltransferase [Desulfarculus baarsii]ADK85857.1 homoserine O-acetyltransferase [Desulfarculus baarsii DSM 2075]